MTPDEPNRRAWNSTLPAMSKKRQAALAAGERKPRKPLPRGDGGGLKRGTRLRNRKAKAEMTEAQRDEQARIEKARDAYRQANWRCELRDLLDRHDPPGWKPFRTAVYTGRAEFELHHILGKRFKGCEEPWNYLMLSPGAHDFCTGALSVTRYGDGRREDAGTSKVGRALCLLAKEAKGEIDFAALGKAPGFYPLGSLAIEATAGCYRGCDSLREAVESLVLRWPPHVLSGPTYLGPDVTC